MSDGPRDRDAKPATPSPARAESTPAQGAAHAVSSGGAEGEGQSKAKAPSSDVVLLGPRTADGDGVHVLRARNERLEAGELRALSDGKPITGEVVSLKPREDNPRICDVASSWTPPAIKGPAQVATKAYRERWDEIFGPRPETPDAAEKRDLN